MFVRLHQARRISGCSGKRGGGHKEGEKGCSDAAPHSSCEAPTTVLADMQVRGISVVSDIDGIYWFFIIAACLCFLLHLFLLLLLAALIRPRLVASLLACFRKVAF